MMFSTPAAEPHGSPDCTLKLSRTQAAFVGDRHPFVLFLGGVGAGKSYAGAVRALKTFERGRPSLGIVVAPTYGMLRDATWRTALEVWRPLIAEALAGTMVMRLTTGDEILFRSADDPERLRGPNAAWAWIDEGALCHPSTWPITIGRLRQHGVMGEAWMTTTPKGMNWVFQVFVTNATEQTTMHRAATWTNPFVDAAFVDSLRAQYDPELALQEIAAEFIADEAGALIPWRHLDQAAGRTAAYDPKHGRVVAGLDVAGPGESETVLCVRQGTGIMEVVAIRETDARGPALAALRPWRHRGLDHVVVDSAGIGHYVARHLEDAGVVVRDVNVGRSPTSERNKERFANLKAELYWGLRERFLDGDIGGLVDRPMFSQLASLRYEHDPRGRVAIESKEDALKRGVPSPDRAEACMLAFAAEDPRALRAQLYGLRSGGVR